MLVRSSDLPSGWSVDENRRRAAKRPRGGEDACDRLFTEKSLMLADEEGPLFVNELEGGFVASSAGLFASEPEARKAYRFFVRTMRSSRGRRCLSDAFEGGRHAGAGVSFRKPRVSGLGYRVAERSWGYRSSFRVHTVCGCLTAYFTLLVMQERQAAVWILSGRVSRPLSREVDIRIARRVAKRMKLAQSARDGEAAAV